MTCSVDKLNGEFALSTLPSFSRIDNQIKNDEIIASEWQKDMFDIKHITSGNVHIKHIITNNISDTNNKLDTINPVGKNDGLIALNVSKNQNEIHSFTKGQKPKSAWFTKN